MHPSIKILCLIALAIAIHLSNGWQLLTIGIVLSVALIYYRADGFWKLLRRVRWLLFFLLLIFAFNTPGEYVKLWPLDVGQAFAPTYEGLSAGLLQAAKLCIMLAGLSLLLVTTNRENLIAGFYLLAAPLRIIKLSPERFAARLWLTLHYVEQAPKAEVEKNGVRQHISDRISELSMLESHTNGAPEHIKLALPDLTWRDILVLTILITAGVYLLCA
ncbi:MAG TPA: CbiQ family ECF transporter T component [Methylophilaceae bacterium]|nr:CbiQ family ECF transporter T component [Methylophilaceae bacterium]